MRRQRALIGWISVSNERTVASRRETLPAHAAHDTVIQDRLVHTCCWLSALPSAICRTEPLAEEGVAVCMESLDRLLALLARRSTSARSAQQLLLTAAAMVPACCSSARLLWTG